MPQYVMLNQPNKMDWLEKPAAQAGNFLWQMAMANYAAKLRSGEAAKEREAEEARYDKRMDTQLAISGFQQIPETEAIPQGAIKVGNKFYKKVAPEYNKVEIDGVPYTYEKGGRLYPLNSTSDSKYKVGELKSFTEGEKEITGIYTGEPTDKIADVAGWKRTGIEAPRYKPGDTKVDIKMPPLETEANKKFGGVIGETAGARLKTAQEAINQNINLDMVQNALEKGARTGWGEETILNVRSAAETLGIDTGDLSGGELVRKVGSEMALRLRNPESGLGLTGNTSNRDLEFLKDATIGLQRTERGNLKIIETTKKVNKFKIDVVKYQNKIIKENNGQVPYDLDDKVLDYVNSYKLFDDKDKTEMKKLSQKVINTGKHKTSGRKTIQYEDGSWELAD